MSNTRNDFSTIRSLVAKHPYKCAWCSEAIEKGTENLNVAGVFHGDFLYYRLHKECHEASLRECYEGDYYPDEVEIDGGCRRGKTHPETEEEDRREQEEEDFEYTDTPVAVHPLICGWCGDIIAIGMKYHEATGSFGGDSYDSLLHEECRAAYVRDMDDKLLNGMHKRGKTDTEAEDESYDSHEAWENGSS